LTTALVNDVLNQSQDGVQGKERRLSSFPCSSI